MTATTTSNISINRLGSDTGDQSDVATDRVYESNPKHDTFNVFEIDEHNNERAQQSRQEFYAASRRNEQAMGLIGLGSDEMFQRYSLRVTYDNFNDDELVLSDDITPEIVVNMGVNAAKSNADMIYQMDRLFSISMNTGVDDDLRQEVVEIKNAISAPASDEGAFDDRQLYQDILDRSVKRLEMRGVVDPLMWDIFQEALEDGLEFAEEQYRVAESKLRRMKSSPLTKIVNQLSSKYGVQAFPKRIEYDSDSDPIVEDDPIGDKVSRWLKNEIFMIGRRRTMNIGSAYMKLHKRGNFLNEVQQRVAAIDIILDSMVSEKPS